MFTCTAKTTRLRLLVCVCVCTWVYVGLESTARPEKVSEEKKEEKGEMWGERARLQDNIGEGAKKRREWAARLIQAREDRAVSQARETLFSIEESKGNDGQP